MDLGGNLQPSFAHFASLMAWWEEAGVDTLVEEAPRDWLAPRPGAPAMPIGATARPSASAAAAGAVVPFPDRFETFQAWLATSDDIALPLSARVAATGDPGSGLMVLVDLPEAGDAAAGRLLTGAAGELFDKMIAAMGRDRRSLYLAAMAPARPAGGYVDNAAGALFGRLARHHVGLARPRALLLMGEQPSRTFLGLGFVEARGRVHEIDVDGHAMSAVATFHPRTLLQHPQQKRRAWEDLQLLMKLLG